MHFNQFLNMYENVLSDNLCETERVCYQSGKISISEEFNGIQSKKVIANQNGIMFRMNPKF